jgi:hypothetical protein
MWECNACTQTNPKSCDSCEYCTSSRTEVVISPLVDEIITSLDTVSLVRWVCRTCDWENRDEYDNCEVCASVRHNLAVAPRYPSSRTGVSISPLVEEEKDTVTVSPRVDDIIRSLDTVSLVRFPIGIPFVILGRTGVQLSNKNQRRCHFWLFHHFGQKLLTFTRSSSSQHGSWPKSHCRSRKLP